jgi:hypothetical protein
MLLAAEAPPMYPWAPTGSILSPLKHWICEQLHLDAPSQRLREDTRERGYLMGRRSSMQKPVRRGATQILGRVSSVAERAGRESWGYARSLAMPPSSSDLA